MTNTHWSEDPDKWPSQPWVGYGEAIAVVRRCPSCGRYITTGKVREKADGTILFEGFSCSIHGEVYPYWVWDND